MEEFLTGHTGPGSRFIRDISDKRFGFERFLDGVVLIDGDGSLVRSEEADDHFKKSRLAGAVRSDQGKDLSRSDRKTDVIDSGLFAEMLGDTGEGEHSRSKEVNESGYSVL